MSFTLYYPDQATATTTVTLRSPEYGNTAQQIRNQASSRSRGGTLYVYDKGTDRYEAQFEFAAMDDDDKQDLESFFADDANGMVNEFQILDHLGDLYDARFLVTELAWENARETSPGGTTPEWNVSFRLEISAAS